MWLSGLGRWCCNPPNKRILQGYSHDAWLFSVKCELNKLYAIHDLRVLHESWRTRIIKGYSWFYHSILCDFEMQVLQIGMQFAFWILISVIFDFLFLVCEPPVRPSIKGCWLNRGSTVFQLLRKTYLNNRPQVSMGYKLINHQDVGRTQEEFVEFVIYL